MALALAVWAGRALVPSTGNEPAPSPEACSPAPCAAPGGFEADVTDATVAAGQVRLSLLFRNHTRPSPGEAVTYRHTSPEDFLLISGTGDRLRPVFGPDCPNWGELQVERGRSSRSMPLCFTLPAAGLHGSRLRWDPDLGFFSNAVLIPLP